MADRQRWRPILFSCPRTGNKVQALLAEDTAGGGGRYEAVSCLACSGTHFVDPVDGKVLGAAPDGKSRRDGCAIARPVAAWSLHFFQATLRSRAQHRRADELSFPQPRQRFIGLDERKDGRVRLADPGEVIAAS